MESLSGPSVDALLNISHLPHPDYLFFIREGVTLLPY